MRRSVAAFTVAVVLTAVPASAQGTLKESHRLLLGCFGEAFTLLEDVWRVGPRHVMLLADQATLATSAAQKQIVAGMVASAVHVDQEAAFAVARNLEGCIDQTVAGMQPDATTAMLATAVRTEVDSAIEDADTYVRQYAAARAAIQGAIDTAATDPHDEEFAAYDTFGTRIAAQLRDIRHKVDALVAAATPGAPAP
jgi:hypothetical protein